MIYVSRLFDYLPDYYRESRQMDLLFVTEENEFFQLQDDVTDTFGQFILDWATWGLERWEEELSIPVDLSKPYEERRSVIRSKLRGTGTVTVELLKNVAQSFERGAIDVIDTPGVYSFEIKFVDTIGLPSNLDDLKAAIEQIKPAHLDVVYSFRYLMVAEVEAMTLAQIEATTMDKIAWG